MIERYTIQTSSKEIATRFNIEEPEAYKARFNAAPSQILPVITHESPQGFSYFYWGSAPQWANNKSFAERIINTRAEWIKEKPVLKKSLRTHRCLIPADGFYAWKKLGKKTQVPWRFTLKSKSLFSMAGLWEEYEDQEGKTFHTFSIITTASDLWIADITERIPLIFSTGEEKIWMNKQASEHELLSLLDTRMTNQLEGYHVSPLINSIVNEGAYLIKPTPATDQFGNLTLFD
jgi:putative SOS response-associated peptidase YedK